MIEVRNLNAGYRRLQILFDVSASFAREKINVIVGPNGSGKSTLLKSIFGLTTIYSGSITLDGIELIGKAPHEIARIGVAYLPQTENIFENLTVNENLRMAGYVLERDELDERIEEVAELFPVIKRYWRRRTGMLSGGERQMVAMAMALIRKPKVMLFDEPTGGLSPKIANEVISKIVELRDSMDMTIILVEQNAKKALEIGDHAYLLVSGRLVFEGGCRELLKHPQLASLYLGVSG
ncbi:MAG: ABC transporter ATP-binding protein [Nitrososphaerota archaeon]|nr:ABC transporter ATP-binding protein [Nitrososphaerota archaeon]